jgi:N-methylhydantoinase A
MSASSRDVSIGVDVGGTFTDIVLARGDGGVVVSKVSSTPDDPGAAVVEGLAALLRRTGIAPAAVAEVVHGTTVASNAILQKKGARTGLITTKGFRDVLEIGRIRTPEMFDLTWDKPVPLVERRWRREVDERIGADGGIVRPLDRAGLLAEAERLVADGVTSIALCFINAYRAPAHELEAERLLRERFPSVDVTASWRVLPEIKEYERTSTAVVNAYLLPIMRRYLANLASGLRAIGIDAPLLVVASNGGVMGAAAAGEKPAFVVGSGPAAGVAGAARLGTVAGLRNLIAFDMGGTTAKASLVEDGRVSLTSEYEFREGISTSSRFIKAGGYMLKVPAVDVAEVGAGAGSIAWIDGGGLLRVGPESAGACPGPACYALGGERPTVTDANVVLGFLNPAHLAGGELPLDAERAHDAIRRHVAGPLGLGAVDAAHGIRQVANANMARAIRSVTIERGRDPRHLTLVAFGGSGPVHAVDLARALEIRRVLVPLAPGVFTAVGMLASDLEHHFVRAHAAPGEAASVLGALDLAAANAALGDVAREARSTLAAEGYTASESALECLADLRYLGQGSELTVPLGGETFTPLAVAGLRAAFRQEYERTYGYSTDEDLELVNVRVVATAARARRLHLGRVRVVDDRPAASGAARRVAFARGAHPVETPVIPRADLSGARQGPLIVESYDSTVVVPPGCTVSTDAAGSLLIALD